MPPSVAVKFVILLILLMLSALFSSAETSLTTVSKLRVRSLAEDGNKRARVLLKLVENPANMLSAILIGNNVVNLSASSLTTSVVLELFGSQGAAIATGILTLLILIFGEITPKRLATLHNEKMALMYAPLFMTFTRLLTPVIFIVNKLSFGVMFILRIDPNEKAAPITESELRTVVDVSHEEGVLENEEHQMITNVVDFGDSLAKDIMVPRIDMVFANSEMSYDELMAVFRQDLYSRMPVYSETRDNIIGVINLKDIFFYEGKAEDFKIQDFLREPFFTYEFKKTSELMSEMRKNNTAMAIVLDEYGATAGLITLEDLLEEIVGEIRDEYDADEQDPLTKINENEYYVQGSMNLNDLCSELKLPFISSDYDTIGGYLIGLFDHLPEKNEIVVTEEEILLQVDEMDKNRISRIYIKLPSKPRD